MKTFTLFALIAGASALALPANNNNNNIVQPVARPAPGDNGSPSPASCSKDKAATGANCSAVQQQLIAGIKANLDIQAKELAGIQALQQGGGAIGFGTQQLEVLCIQQQGIQIRQNNQQLAAQINSPAIAGLAIVENAQTLEMSQVTGLNRTATDAATLTLLVQEVRDGTAQNQKNLAAAQGQVCGN
ncbi:hypothetical protein ACEQ8H_006433 [Pleosporales sp. CAS-2024a]